MLELKFAINTKEEYENDKQDKKTKPLHSLTSLALNIHLYLFITNQDIESSGKQGNLLVTNIPTCYK
jgi:hypothetical protein